MARHGGKGLALLDQRRACLLGCTVLVNVFAMKVSNAYPRNRIACLRGHQHVRSFVCALFVSIAKMPAAMLRQLQSLRRHSACGCIAHAVPLVTTKAGRVAQVPFAKASALTKRLCNNSSNALCAAACVPNCQRLCLIESLFARLQGADALPDRE